MDFKFDRPRQDKIADDVIITELKRIAKLVGYKTFTRHEFDKMASACKGSAVLNRFKTWKRALEATGLNLSPYKNPGKTRFPKVISYWNWLEYGDNWAIGHQKLNGIIQMLNIHILHIKPDSAVG